MADEPKVGDPVITKASTDPRMVISAISGEKKATCYYFNRLSGLFVWVELPLAALVKVG